MAPILYQLLRAILSFSSISNFSLPLYNNCQGKDKETLRPCYHQLMVLHVCEQLMFEVTLTPQLYAFQETLCNYLDEYLSHHIRKFSSISINLQLPIVIYIIYEWLNDGRNNVTNLHCFYSKTYQLRKTKYSL